jgi:penicillin-binding protein 1B
MQRRWLIFSILFLAVISLCACGIYDLDQSLQKRLSQGWFLPPIEYYSSGLHFTEGGMVNVEAAKAQLLRQEYRERTTDETLREKDFASLDPSGCRLLVGDGLSHETKSCLAIRPSAKDWAVLSLSESSKVLQMWKGEKLSPTTSLSLTPILIAQFYEGQPLFKEPTSLPTVPLACLQGITAIEDADFLKHKGVSVLGIMRAIYRNLTAGHWAEGGSTITQQLVKNYFLTPKKTIRRKITEQVLSILLEARSSKDVIFEQYLNVIFMGLAGPYQIRGLASASRYYFGKNVSQLGLAECATLAALINSPGRYNPFEHPDRTIKRRDLVLQKMLAQDLISRDELVEAHQIPLPTKPGVETQSPAPYYLQAAQREFDQLDLFGENKSDKGLRIFTSLNSNFQDAATRTIHDRITERERTLGAKSKSKEPLEMALISVDLASHHITALIGGRNYQQTQFNRAIEAYRQVGSIMKPFVYLAAMAKLDPLSERLDTPFEQKVGHDLWAPKNYDGQYRGTVPLFVGLAQSLNIPAARTALEIGIENVADGLARAGVTKTIPRNPSLALGAFELSPLEIAQAYSTLGNFGVYQPLHTIERIETLDGDLIWDESSLPRQTTLSPENSAEVIGMMKATPILGTAQGLKSFNLPQVIAAKTGTTNDLKDAWFIGLTPGQLTVVWTGFDNNEPVGTGAQMALPVWGAFTQKISAQLTLGDFPWPSGTEVRKVDLVALSRDYHVLRPFTERVPFIDLVFKK